MRISKKTGLAVAITLTVILQTFLLITPGVHASTIIYPIADSWVGNDFPTVNHGQNVTLHCRSDTSLLSGNVTKRSYLKFDVTGIDPDTIASATLYLYCTQDTPNTTMAVDAHKTGDNWIEGPAVGDIDWNNAPAVGAYITTTAVGGVNQTYGWSGDAMTNYVKAEATGDGIVSFVLKLPSDTVYTHPAMWHRDFSSKQGSFSPYLEIAELPPAGGHMIPIKMAEESSLSAIPIYFISVLIVAMAATTILIRRERKRAAKTLKGH